MIPTGTEKYESESEVRLVLGIPTVSTLSCLAVFFFWLSFIDHHPENSKTKKK